MPVDRDRFLFGKTVALVAMGGRHGVVLDTAGQAYTWGLGTALGGGSSQGSDVPVPVETHAALFGDRPGTDAVVDVAGGDGRGDDPRPPHRRRLGDRQPRRRLIPELLSRGLPLSDDGAPVRRAGP